jgi:mannose-1-phosphate guanylyltransferase
MNIVPVVLAGGIGERFWPFSRSSMPKQLLPIISNKSMIEETFTRVKPFCKKGVKPLVVTGKLMAGQIKKKLAGSVAYDCIVEPVGKNTAPAVAAAAAWISNKYGPESIMIVLSADHAIAPVSHFVSAVKYAVELSDSLDNLIVFGIKPLRPDTGYGYIYTGKKTGVSADNSSYQVLRFVEKPTKEKAEEYLASGAYLWNSGMFVWKVSVILEEFRQSMPDLYKKLKKAQQAGLTPKAIDAFYTTCEKQSIDYGIMEQSRRVTAVQGIFTWDDIGSWESLPRVIGMNDKETTLRGKNIYEKECAGAIIANNSRMTVAAIGLENVVIAVCDDSILVISRDKVPDVKKYISEMKEMGYSRKLF